MELQVNLVVLVESRHEGVVELLFEGVYLVEEQENVLFQVQAYVAHKVAYARCRRYYAVGLELLYACEHGVA